ncbi:uncharacterized protein FOMMEDRAFT_160907 [Fomitiporia mediterranea MF3/22]|uniref:uncharacterized protein n=1 Tax=Fomitiporia mediterranea (strain MF3/22) TaxID=694068 RepID=UPI00044089EC|nr:uncharacterized protein FOMMEDRAFT_160907 [Fomitiporia mediterranea MF3/22]EJC99302.1 hypothetical protein FOMMEDRAFT_160907 [Fomitiporia mediterranea MF3/22]
MLASVYRRPPPLSLPFLIPRCVGCAKRSYTQQRTARTARSTTQQTTTNPSPSVQTKNRNLPPSGSNVQEKPKKASAAPEANEKAFLKIRQEQSVREMESSGSQLDLLRMSLAKGIEPWGAKTPLMDLRIPSRPTSFRAIKENMKNNLSNMLRSVNLPSMNPSAFQFTSMHRLATDFAFPGIITKWRISPQLFRAKSTSEKAWVAPFREELFELYRRVNEAIASGDKKAITKVTAYEYQTHAFKLLQRNLSRIPSTGYTNTWKFRPLSPVQILSLRAFPMYTAAEEPRYGNRNVVQALVRFESMQSLTLRDSRDRVLLPNGVVAPEGYEPEPRRVLEYLICENKMFYKDGWYVRDQMFEGIKPKFRDVGR